ncbi:MAG: HAMP domain-containing protein [Candidatus Latescibacteria bacterium]|nr:HAMP domain-containing protein [Candidatus Latescibacterota bacterium]
MIVRQILSSKIVWKLVLILIPLTVFPILSLGWLLAQTGQTAVRKAVLRDYQEIATRAAQEIELLVRSPQEILSATAAMVGVTHTDLWKQETAVVQLRLNARIFEQLYFIDTDGRIKASGNLDYETPDSTIMIAFRWVMASPDTAFYRSDVYLLNGKIPAMTMAVPVKQLGRTIGVLATQVNLRGMWTLVDRINIGQQGSLYITSKDGVVIAHRDKKPVLTRANWKMLAPVEHVLAGQKGSLDYTDPRGQTVLSAYAPIPSLGWGTIVEQPEAEAYATIGTMTQQSIWLVVVSVVLALVIGILTARSTVKPVLRLVEGTRRISQGDLTYRIDIQRQDEIGQLATSFNEMAGSLKASYDGLEQTVAERTAQLQHALEEVERLNQLKSDFVSEVAHELRTPLTTIKGYTDTLVRLSQTLSEERKFQCYETISDEIARLSRLINDLLDLSRIEAGKVALRKEPLDLVVVARQTLAAAQARAVEKRIRFELHAPDGLPDVLADSDAIRRVFDNLIDNAIKYTPPGGTVSVSIVPKGDRVGVNVADTGIGIAEKDIGRIFDRFFRVKMTGGRVSGTGLGLPIVKSIVEEHGGAVSASSVVGQGSVLSFTLPAVTGKETTYDTQEAYSRY